MSKKILRTLGATVLVMAVVLFVNVPSFFTLPVSAQDSVLTDDYTGVWEGQGFQDNGTEWSILLSIVPSEVDAIAGTIAYPSLSCGGELALMSADGDSIELSETLTYGHDRCIDRGTVSLSQISSTRLSYTWFYPGGSHGANGEVRKISAR